MASQYFLFCKFVDEYGPRPLSRLDELQDNRWGDEENEALEFGRVLADSMPFDIGEGEYRCVVYCVCQLERAAAVYTTPGGGYFVHGYVELALPFRADDLCHMVPFFDGGNLRSCRRSRLPQVIRTFGQILHGPVTFGSERGNRGALHAP